eukprot:CAMPEP_0119526340 /NCGR_PEP_ID=MMETSP1344-20130328/40974_1 /TAXON_ID=236787 /ORGANISM="Florenciella parvula, Strain CCMP2471" /LENGTH=70 /DNA_ID=CAMNT_0007565309 /DNA_START=50 /DNA_END=263 /DNA_ORIENTATION=-
MARDGQLVQALAAQWCRAVSEMITSTTAAGGSCVTLVVQHAAHSALRGEPDRMALNVSLIAASTAATPPS